MKGTIIVLILVLIFIPIGAYALDNTPLEKLAIAFNVFTESQTEIINQNDILIQQNNEIIKLLKGNYQIFVPGMTERYDVMKFTNSGVCEYYDRLERTIKTGTCPILGLTKEQFLAKITGKPER